MLEEKFIIDTDIGDDIDDAYAIAYLSQEIRDSTIGITTVFKNALQRAKITSHLLRLLRWNVPVYTGESKPLKANINFLPFEKICENPTISQYRDSYKDEVIGDESAVDFILDSLKKEQKLTLVCVGPLTNIALAIKKDPETFRRANKLLLMAGSFDANRVEWNVRCDPEAFEIVLNSGVPIEMVGFNITKHALLSQEDVDRLSAMESEPLQFLNDITSKYIDYYNRSRLPCMHDPLTASLINHEFVKTKIVKVKADMTEGRKGMCLAEEDGVPVQVAYEADYPAFKAQFLKTLEKIDLNTIE